MPSQPIDPMHAVLSKLERIEAGIFGDISDPGRPGLVGRVAALEGEAKSTKFWGKVSVGAAAAAIGAALRHMLGWDHQ